jgi:hypothetical protein
MLLAKKAHPFEHLTGALSRDVETLPEVGILFLELVETLGTHVSLARCAVDCLDTRFCLKRTTPEVCKLLTEMPDELLELVEGFDVRTFAV